jgi:hypothetical protein
VDNDFQNDGLQKSAEIWFNELRLRSTTRAAGGQCTYQVRLADLGVISVVQHLNQFERTESGRPQQEETNQIVCLQTDWANCCLKIKVSYPCMWRVTNHCCPNTHPNNPTASERVIREAETAANGGSRKPQDDRRNTLTLPMWVNQNSKVQAAVPLQLLTHSRVQ